MLELLEEFADDEQDNAVVELRVALSRETLTAALYDSTTTAEELAEMSPAEVASLVMSALVFNGAQQMDAVARRTLAGFAGPGADEDSVSWWVLCAVAVDRAFFGAALCAPVRAGVSA